MTIIEKHGKQYDLKKELTFQEVEYIIREARNDDTVKRMDDELNNPSESERKELSRQHNIYLDDMNRVIRQTLKRCLELSDNEIDNMTFIECSELINEILVLSYILARK